MKRVLLMGSLSIVLASSVVLAQAEEKAMLAPPAATKHPKETKLHGDTLVDDYFWLREKTNPEVISYLEAENAYTESVLGKTSGLQDSLYKEMLGRIKQTDLSVPSRKGQYFYYSRTEEGKQYPIYCRKKENLEGNEEIILDMNVLAEGQKYLGLGAFEVSDDANLLAYTTDNTGFRQYTMHVKDLRTGKTLPDTIEKTVSVAWAADNKTIFYTVEDHAKRPYRAYRHTLGGKDDPLVYEEKDELYLLWASRTRSRKYITLTVASSTTTEVWTLPAADPDAKPKLILPRAEDHEYYVDHHGEHFYIRTNENAKNFRLVKVPVANPQRKSWTEVVGHRDDVMLEDFDLFANHLVLSEREDGLPTATIIDLRNGKQHRLEFPEPVYSMFLDSNREFETATLRYRYQSFVTPDSVFDYEMNDRKRTLLKQTEVLGGYDPAKYQTERISATAADGTKIPISLLYLKGTERNSENPLLLYGYGSYGSPMSGSFSSSRFSLVDRGVVFAIAHIRGGGEMGQKWHDQGRMKAKKNTFTDFISSAEHLIAQKFTSKEHLAIMGGSAGGLLTGAVTNMRPDLFKVVVSLVPFVDVVNTMLDETLPLTVGEFLEWGNPKVKDEYDYIKTYCPYTNIAKKDYPTMLVRTSLNDSQVMYWESAKYVAKLRANKSDQNLLVLRTNMAAGHGGSSGRYDRLKETAFDYAFVLTQLGVVK